MWTRSGFGLFVVSCLVVSWALQNWWAMSLDLYKFKLGLFWIGLKEIRLNGFNALLSSNTLTNDQMKPTKYNSSKLKIQNSNLTTSTDSNLTISTNKYIVSLLSLQQDRVKALGKSANPLAHQNGFDPTRLTRLNWFLGVGRLGWVMKVFLIVN